MCTWFPYCKPIFDFTLSKTFSTSDLCHKLCCFFTNPFIAVYIHTSLDFPLSCLSVICKWNVLSAWKDQFANNSYSTIVHCLTMFPKGSCSLSQQPKLCVYVCFVRFYTTSSSIYSVVFLQKTLLVSKLAWHCWVKVFMDLERMPCAWIKWDTILCFSTMRLPLPLPFIFWCHWHQCCLGLCLFVCFFCLLFFNYHSTKHNKFLFLMHILITILFFYNS